MKEKYYKDVNVVCPFYSREESDKSRKIHCEGYMDGTHLHIHFDTKELKKLHKKKYCKSITGYKSCPLYPAIAKKHKEGENER